MAGELGDLPFGWPEPFRSKVLAGRTVDVSISPLSGEDEKGLMGSSRDRQATLNRLLFPGPSKILAKSREQFGDLSVLDTVDYLYGLEVGSEHIVDIGQGLRLFVGLEAIGEPDDKGTRTVLAILNGQVRPVSVRDRSINAVERNVERADMTNVNHVSAPFAGVVSMRATAGATVIAGETIASIEAMKMEAAITAPHSGLLERLVFSGARDVEAGDLLAVVLPIDATSPRASID
jgi:pyruvate carboxylase